MKEFRREQKAQRKKARRAQREARIQTQSKYASFWLYLSAFLGLTLLSILIVPATIEWAQPVYVNMLFAAVFILKGVRARRYGMAKESTQAKGVSQEALQKYSAKYGTLLVIAGAIFLIISYLLQMEFLDPWPYFGIMTALCGVLFGVERRLG